MVVYQEEGCLEEGGQEGAFLEEVSLEVGPSEAVLGPRAPGVCPRVVEVQEVLVDLEDQVDPSAANLPLPSSCQGPSYEGQSWGEAPSLGVPWGPSLAVAHVAPRNQVGVVHVVPSLRGEGASLDQGPNLDQGGPNLEVVDPSPGEGILDLDPSLRRTALLECEANATCNANSAPLG